MSERLQVGIDFSQKRADFCLLFPDGRPLEAHQAFANSTSGYAQAKQLLLETLEAYAFSGVDVSGEATGYFWLPFFLQLAADPDLAAHDLDLFLLNPRWVKWFKQCFPEDDKSDARDAFYIAERTRTRRPEVAWTPPEGLSLRIYTRYRYHLTQDLAREKSYFSAFLFLKASAYRRREPFSDVFGVTSRQVLSQPALWDDVADLPVEELADHLYELSGHHLPNPSATAHKLQHVRAESFVLDAALATPVQYLLDRTLEHIHFLEQQRAQVDRRIAAALDAYPVIRQLATIPGVGPVFSSGIGAEIGGIDRFLQGQTWDKRRRRYRARNLRDAEDAVAKIAGLWWPRSGSGDFEAEDRHLAKSGNRYLRYYLIKAADLMRCHIPEYQAYYQRKYDEVTKHQYKRALVLTARKSVGLIVGLLHRDEPYRSKEARYPKP